MAEYYINSPSLSNYGAKASPKTRQTLAITGVFDFPKRDGDSEFNWGDEVEAFTDTEDFEWKEKSCTLRVFLQGSDAEDYETKLTSFKNNSMGLSSLSSDYGLDIEDLRTTGVIEVVEHLKDNAATCTINFIAQDGILSGVLGTASGGSGYLLDGYSFIEDFGLYVQKRNDNKSVAKYQDYDTTVDYETLPTASRQPRDIQLDVTMIATSLSDFTAQMGKLHQLLASEGLRTLTFPDGNTHQVYCKDGFKINTVKTGGNVSASFYLKLREIE